ncbi:MAG: oxidative damage protection protein [Planctomycetes bacterium]|nr:oxidative damage protection protein [Planctomycetota bacterium]
MVNCVKFGREMEGLSEVPWNNDLGRRIFNEVSIEAWKMWQSQETMIINEYHLQLWKPDDRKKLYAMCESFLFGGGLQPPPEYVAPDAALAHGEEHAHHHYPHG